VGSNLLLFGCDYYPDKRFHEINFWNDLVKQFSGHYEQVVILSVNYRKDEMEQLGDNVYLYNVRPRCYSKKGTQGDPDYTGSKFNSLPFALIYKSCSFLKFRPVLERIISRHNIGIVHYFRIFGLFNSALFKAHPEIAFTVTVPTHIDRGYPLHRFYHWIKYQAMQPMDRIITTSQATLNRLIQLGVGAEQLQMIHWSTEFCGEELTAIERTHLESKYGIPPDARVVVWSGPLQDTTEKDFNFALSVATGAAQRGSRDRYIFAFKPGKRYKGYSSITAKWGTITLLETSKEEFNDLRRLADIFLSPILNRKRTVAPPLTWIEMMQNGTPVITSNVDGTGEIIIHGKTGYIANTIGDSINVLLEITNEDLSKLKQNAKKFVAENYNLESIAKKYINLWKFLAKS